MKFHSIIQKDSLQCGIACLQMICKYYGKEYSYSYVSKICIATTEGVSMLALEEAAVILNLKPITGRLTVGELYYVSNPCILHWNQNHFVVLYKVKKGKKFYIADPGKGLVSYNIDDFKQHWIGTGQGEEGKGIAMFLEPDPQFYKQKKGLEKDDERSFGFLFGYIDQYRKYFLQILLGLFVGSLLQLALPFLTQNIVDIGIKNQDIGFIWLILLGQLVITISRTSVDFIRRWLLLHISMRINISLVSDFFIKLLQLPMSFFDTKLMGDLMQRIGDHSRVNSFLTQQTLSVAFSMISFAVFSCVLLVYNRLIFFIFLLGSLLYGGWMTLFLRRRKVIDYELFEQQAINNNKTYQFLTSMQEIKLQDCEQRRRWEWEDVQADLFKVQMKSLKLQQTQEAGSIFINELKNMTITVVSATAVINGSLTLGMMLAVQYIIGQLNSPIEQLMHFIYSIQDVKISLERINEIHKKDNEEDAGRIRTELGDESHDIVLSHIDFKYDPHALSKTIEDVSIYIPEGKITAIVGASGSGKTTLIKLMLGYYPVMNGEITIAGHNITEYNLKWWRRQCGVVMQDGVIFSESIARNIAVDDDEINQERLEMAAEIANVKDFVMALPLKFNTNIGRDGMGLSQGQKQLLCIARAMLTNPEILILDEATSSIDTLTEIRVQKAFAKMMSGRTSFVVAHRLSTIKESDIILVMRDGNIVEQGSHKELLNKKGFYYELYHSQFNIM